MLDHGNRDQSVIPDSQQGLGGWGCACKVFFLLALDILAPPRGLKPGIAASLWLKGWKGSRETSWEHPGRWAGQWDAEISAVLGVGSIPPEGLPTLTLGGTGLLAGGLAELVGEPQLHTDKGLPPLLR